MKKIIKSHGLLVAIAILIIALDQILKAIVRSNLNFGESWSPFSGFLKSFIRVVHWENYGAAFGLFQGGGVVFGLLAAVVSLVIIIFYSRIPHEHVLMRVALAMQMGGALGNLIDRIRFGPVTDFIAVGTFPVFNIADASITVGVALLLFALWYDERKEKARLRASETAQQDHSETV
ncbi:MAG TPA: signal peptidase II [Brevefilum fermentans]|uniref:Lipoprotein signal peptidase n=1 Tax=Candidatus Brevifilum fermentans TaxID=1986204 RepID=A0A1Y6K8G0_9CHLR|nr:signal peptidase II [Brevefilum fermentans]SMX54290.1 Lipoprotein signal peptidase [Brevefilum fermentans]HQA29663.1 signal peptidase II [Brevefilum fermentans]